MAHPKRWISVLAAFVIVVGACGGGSSAVAPTDELPTINEAQLRDLLAVDPRPAVVNIWASWCIPCRSEAPLLGAAHDTLGEEVAFIGVAVADNQSDSVAFLSEFGLTFDNYFDRPRNIPAALGRTGVPITFFFAGDGTLVHAHSGVIDERTLAVNIDDLLAR